MENPSKLIKTDRPPSLERLFLFAKQQFGWTVLQRAYKVALIAFICNVAQIEWPNDTEVQELCRLHIWRYAHVFGLDIPMGKR